MLTLNKIAAKETQNTKLEINRIYYFSLGGNGISKCRFVGRSLTGALKFRTMANGLPFSISPNSISQLF